jgi:hypothetical protein
MNDWKQVWTAVGAGPRLVKDGKLAVNPVAEGFKESKILTGANARSGIGVKKDGSIIIATVHAATIQDWASIMIKLGADQAMNLDGGASSGLYGSGKYLTSPGRKISMLCSFPHKESNRAFYLEVLIQHTVFDLIRYKGNAIFSKYFMSFYHFRCRKITNAIRMSDLIMFLILFDDLSCSCTSFNYCQLDCRLFLLFALWVIIT